MTKVTDTSLTSTDFTNGFLDALQGRESTYSIGDASCPGLRIRVTPAGTKSFTFNGRDKATGAMVNKTIGRYGPVSLKDARRAVRGATDDIEDGVSPDVILPRGDELTFKAALDEYKTQRLALKRTGKEIGQVLATLMTTERWTTRSIKSLTKLQVRAALQKMIDRGVRPMATRTQRLLSTFFYWCEDAGHIDRNPIARMGDMGEGDNVGDRVLEPHEIALMWRVLNDAANYGFDPIYARSLLLSMVTGVRPGLPSRMRCADIKTDDRKRGWYWDLSRKEMKMDRRFIMPLNRLARDIIGKQVDLKHDTFVCPTTSGDFRDQGKCMRHRSLNRRLNALIERLKKAGMNIETFEPRDLRRTAATLLRSHPKADGKRYSREDLRPYMSHQPDEDGARRKSRGTVMDHYDHWDAYEEKREIGEHLADIITRIVSEHAGLRLAA